VPAAGGDLVQTASPAQGFGGDADAARTGHGARVRSEMGYGAGLVR